MRSYKTCMHTCLDEIAFLKSTNTLERLRAVMESLTKWVRPPLDEDNDKEKLGLGERRDNDKDKSSILYIMQQCNNDYPM